MDSRSLLHFLFMQAFGQLDGTIKGTKLVYVMHKTKIQFYLT